LKRISLDDFRWLMGNQFLGVVYGVKMFSAAAEKERRAQIVNISSVFGIVAPAGQSAILPASLRCADLRRHCATNSKALLFLFPACILGGFARRLRGERGWVRIRLPLRGTRRWTRFDRLTPTMPDAAAGAHSQGVERREPRILIGRDARQIDILQRTAAGDILEDAGAARPGAGVVRVGYTPRKLAPRFGQRVRRGHKKGKRGLKWGLCGPRRWEMCRRGRFEKFHVEGKAIALANVGGQFHAIDNTCIHRGGPLAMVRWRGTW